MWSSSNDDRKKKSRTTTTTTKSDDIDAVTEEGTSTRIQTNPLKSVEEKPFHDNDDNNNSMMVNGSSSPTAMGATILDTTTSSTCHTCSKTDAYSKSYQRLSRILDQYSRYVGNSWNQDKLLKTLHYSLWMVSRFYAKSPHSQEGLSFLNSEILWARYVTRLLGWPTAVQELFPINNNPTNDGDDDDDTNNKVFRFLGKAMAWSMVVYYPLEALAYLKWKVPKFIAPSYGAEHRLAERASAWSCRAWVVYIILDMVRSVTVLSLDQKPTASTKQTKNREGTEEAEDDMTNETDNNDDAAVAALTDPSDIGTIVLTRQQRTSERLQILRNALYLAPAVHWSLPHWDTQPWLSDTTCKTLMWLEAVVCMIQSVANLPPPSC